jgi:hypothetical protein
MHTHEWQAIYSHPQEELIVATLIATLDDYFTKLWEEEEELKKYIEVHRLTKHF